MSNKPRAIITGITGQDGSYLAEFLFENGYEVFGLIRRSRTEHFGRIQHSQHELELMLADLTDQVSMSETIKSVRPSEVNNVAAQSFVPTSWNPSIPTGVVTALGATRVMEAIRLVDPHIRFFQSLLSEMFGNDRIMPQAERTPFYPRSPYGASKVHGHWIAVRYHKSYNLFAVSDILFNHESLCRSLDFLTRKVASATARIKLGIEKKLRIGNLDAKRDWGYAKDCVKAMRLMLQLEKPGDCVVAMGGGTCRA